MTMLSNHALDLFQPLRVMYSRLGLALPPMHAVEGADMPQWSRRLLVHDGDMTPTLEAHHRATLHLHLLHRLIDGQALLRLVVLRRDDIDAPVEFGAIRIHLDRLPEAARDQVIASRKPLGSILADHAITHLSRPRGYFSVVSDPIINRALNMGESATLYGRSNLLLNHAGQPLAEVVEILPPPPTEDKDQHP